MKLKTMVMSLAVATLFFASCEDSKKKEAEAQAQAEQIRMEREKDSLMEVEAENQAKKAEMEANSIAAKAMGNSELSTLVSALQAADMAQTLKSEGEYTVFAPTNEAFSKLPKGKWEELMKPENKEKLQELLKYHIILGKLNSVDLMAKIKESNNKYEVSTIDGENIVLMEKNGKVLVKDAKGNTVNVTSDALLASNGVVYTVEKVLIPATKM